METDLSLEKFNPTVAELNALVAQTSTRLFDEKNSVDVDYAHNSRMSIRAARVKIEKFGKQLRENAITFQKAVIVKERELIAIIEPEESRLAVIEEAGKLYQLKTKRLQSFVAGTSGSFGWTRRMD